MFAKLVVLISGAGSNLQAILDACQEKALPATVVAVISNNANAFGLSRAEAAGAKAIYFPKLAGEQRYDYDFRLANEVEKLDADYIVLAGWMRLLSSVFLKHFPGRVINLHPALPGTFPGTHAIERAYAAFQCGETDHSGVMVHLVPDEGVDNGPVLAYEEVYFQSGETLDRFEARMHVIEHRLLVDTLKKVINGDI